MKVHVLINICSNGILVDLMLSDNISKIII